MEIGAKTLEEKRLLLNWLTISIESLNKEKNVKLIACVVGQWFAQNYYDLNQHDDVCMEFLSVIRTGCVQKTGKVLINW